ncbi:MAG TPA: sugar transferase [Terriglobales bacterium]|nr:sugar transferase [Terriglobales bacterium]
MVIRLFNAYFPRRTLLLALSEAGVVVLAFTVSCIIWMGRDADLFLNYEGGFVKITLITAVFLICMYYGDLYDSLILTNRREVIIRLIQVMGAGTLVLAVLYSAYPSTRLGVKNFVLGLFLVLLLVWFWRELFLWLFRSKHLLERAILLGDGPLSKKLAHEILTRPDLGLQLLGYVSVSSSQARSDLPYLGTPDRLAEVVRAQGVRHVLVTMPDQRGKLPMDELLSIKSQYARVQDGAEIYEKLTGKLPIESLRLSWLLFSPGFHTSRWLSIWKSIFSFLISLVLLILFLPVMLLIAIAIRLDSPGDVIFKQERVGQGGKIFTLYKFRSMYHGADANGNHAPAEEHDGRVTRLGRVLRRTRLDELPQLYNILCGDMHFVGPRPFVPDQEEVMVKAIPFYSQRWNVKPGATGWAQINRGYCATVEDNADKLAYDLFYIKNISISLDLLIIFKTMKILALGRGGR